MRLALGIVFTFTAASALAWNEGTHRQLVSDALTSVDWLKSYTNLKPTPFGQMVKDVFGQAKPVGAREFRYLRAATRHKKRAAYLEATEKIPDAEVRKFAQHLFLSDQVELGFELGEKEKGLSAKEILAAYAAEPDKGMDKGLDAAWYQALMGGTHPKKTSSQGFRHMAFLFGLIGQAPSRAQLFFDIARKAIAQGHEYWGFRFASWGMHYLADMGTPAHTHMLPALRFIRLKGMLLPRGQDGKRRLNKGVLGDIFSGAVHINGNYHGLYERFIDQVYLGEGRASRALRAAVRGKPPGKLGLAAEMVFGPRSVKGVAIRRSWSRKSTPPIARASLRYFTERFRGPRQGQSSNKVIEASSEDVAREVTRTTTRLPRERNVQYRARLAARNQILRRTAKEFRANGRALRRAVNILGRQLGTVGR